MSAAAAGLAFSRATSVSRTAANVSSSSPGVTSSGKESAASFRMRSRSAAGSSGGSLSSGYFLLARRTTKCFIRKIAASRAAVSIWAWRAGSTPNSLATNAPSGRPTSISSADSSGGVSVPPSRYAVKRPASAASPAASCARNSASSAASRSGSYRSPYRKPSIPSAKSLDSSRGALPAPFAKANVVGGSGLIPGVAELDVVDQLDVLGLLALSAHRAQRIARTLELAELHPQRVEVQLAPRQRLALAEQHLDRLGRLQRADHTAQHAEHARLLAGRRHVRGRRLRVVAAVAGTLERQERGHRALEPIDAAVDQRLAQLQRRVVDQVARREVVRAVDDHVVVLDDVEDVRRIEARLVPDHLHVRVQLGDRRLRRLDLGHADPIRRVQDLPLQVRRVDRVVVDEPDRADTRGRQVEAGGRSQAARAETQHLRLQ